MVSDDATALTALSSALMLLGRDVSHALSLADRALALDPNHAWAWMRRGWGLVYLGQPEEGLVAFQKTERLSPLDPFMFNVYLGMGLASFATERPQVAIQFARRALAERPGLNWPYRDLATYFAHAGETAAAADALEKFLRFRPGMTVQQVGDSLRFMYPSLLARYLQGLKLAGMP
jgi:tetratricopeptide (TPR) repeat protein